MTFWLGNLVDRILAIFWPRGGSTSKKSLFNAVTIPERDRFQFLGVILKHLKINHFFVVFLFST